MIARQAVPKLTPMQLRVLEQIATGKSYAEIGHQMGLSVQTVKNHAHAIHKRLNVQTSIQAFIVMGWITVQSETWTTT